MRKLCLHETGFAYHHGKHDLRILKIYITVKANEVSFAAQSTEAGNSGAPDHPQAQSLHLHLSRSCHPASSVSFQRRSFGEFLRGSRLWAPMVFPHRRVGSSTGPCLTGWVHKEPDAPLWPLTPRSKYWLMASSVASPVQVAGIQKQARERVSMEW